MSECPGNCTRTSFSAYHPFILRSNEWLLVFFFVIRKSSSTITYHIPSNRQRIPSYFRIRCSSVRVYRYRKRSARWSFPVGFWRWLVSLLFLLVISTGLGYNKKICSAIFSLCLQHFVLEMNSLHESSSGTFENERSKHQLIYQRMIRSRQQWKVKEG